jgi:(2Fe-2S) ferredoxin
LKEKTDGSKGKDVMAARYVLVCQNVDCKSRGSEELMKEIDSSVKEKGCADIEVKPYMCFGACHEGPNIVLYPERTWYAGVKKEDLNDIVANIQGGPKIERLDKIDASLKELIFQLLDAGLF